MCIRDSGIDGFSLAEKMQKQAERFGARSEYAEVLRMDLTAVPKLVETSEGIFRGKTVVLATGADPRTLGAVSYTHLLSDEGREVTLFRLYPGELCVLSASCAISQITFDTQMTAGMDTDCLLYTSRCV